MQDKSQPNIFFTSNVLTTPSSLFMPAVLCLRQYNLFEQPEIYFIVAKLGVVLPEPELAKAVSDNDLEEAKTLASVYETFEESTSCFIKNLKKRGYYPIANHNKLIEEMNMN